MDFAAPSHNKHMSVEMFVWEQHDFTVVVIEGILRHEGRLISFGCCAAHCIDPQFWFADGLDNRYWHIVRNWNLGTSHAKGRSSDSFASSPSRSLAPGFPSFQARLSFVAETVKVFPYRNI